VPDPRKLKVGDRVRFVAMADEWSQPNYKLPRADREFMKAMIKRQFPSRIDHIDEFGFPWIIARLKGGRDLHMWGIMESTGWRRVKKRK
jgi:hypothetical protein